MVTYKEASQIAFEYFDNCLNVKGIAEAMETNDKFVFCGGKLHERSIGGVSITVDKKTSEIVYLRFPSKESTRIIQSAKELEVLKDFVVD